MKRGWILGLFLFLFSNFAGAVVSVGEFQSSVVTGGYIWSEPGYSWFDCLAAEPGFDGKTPAGFAASQRYMEPGVKEACQGRSKKKLESGTDVDLVMDHDRFVTKTLRAKVGSVVSDKKFFKVRDAETGEEGWMSADYLSDPRQKEIELPAPAPPPAPGPGAVSTTGSREKNEAPCPPAGSDRASADKIEKLRRDASDIGAEVSKMAMGRTKTDAELDHFACVYRGDVTLPELKKILPEMKRTSVAAEKAFGIPAPILRCAMLVESALVSSAHSDKNASGYAQVLAGTVTQLSEVSERPGYTEAWKRYRALEPKARLSDTAVRTRSEMPSAMGAMALYLQYMLKDFVSKDCRDCNTKDGTLTRKEIYLLIAGYNGGAKQIERAALKNPVQMMSSFPPPEQTRGYLVKMENCLQGGVVSAFHQTQKQQAANARRKSEIARIASEQHARHRSDPQMNKLKSDLEKSVQKTSGNEYSTLRQAECNTAYPL